MKIKLSIGQKLLLSFSIIVIVALELFCLTYYRNVQRQKQYNEARSWGDAISTSIHLSIEDNVELTNYMKNLYLKYHENFVNDFEFIAEDFVINRFLVKLVCIAPDGIITKIYPSTSDFKEAIGQDLLTTPGVSNSALNTIKQRTITVSGPHNLLSGGTGLVVRNPIFENGKFVGFAIVVLDWNLFADSISSRIAQNNKGYKFSIVTYNRDNIANEGILFQNFEGEISKKVKLQINIPGETWYMYVEPESGWKDFSNMVHEIFFSIILCIIIFLLILSRQISNSKKLYKAQHDDLTNLLSRSTFLTFTENLLNNPGAEKFVIVAADIENFKVTNSIYGTRTGDEILRYLADKFSTIALYNFCTRFGSDHFVFIIRDFGEEKNISYINEFAEAIANSAPIPNLTVKYGYYGNVTSNIPINLLCDKALLAAKSILHNYDKVVANYDGPLSTKNERAQFLESSFLYALNNNDFKVWYQPKFDSLSNKIIGAEALVRWIRNDGTLISPAEFIHVFEDDGLIYKLDLYVFNEVCEKIKIWMDKGVKILPISINISRNTLQHKGSIEEYNKILTKYGIPPEYVPLEITESSTAANKQIKDLTEELQNTGFKIHLDDFGSGLSSLESLNLLPFEVVKLDKSLIDFIGTPIGEELLRHVIELLQFMDLEIIAEGVEDKDQLNFLQKYNCNHIQGYLFSPPMPYDKFITLIKSNLYS